MGSFLLVIDLQKPHSTYMHVAIDTARCEQGGHGYPLMFVVCFPFQSSSYEAFKRTVWAGS